MYIDARTLLDLPFDDARSRLLAVRPEGHRRMTVPVAGRLVTKAVDVDLGLPVEERGLVSIPLRWTATWPSAAFPCFHAELELARLSDGSAELWLLGRYQPPLGPVGRLLDRAVLHTLARASVRQVLETMAAHLQHPAQGG